MSFSQYKHHKHHISFLSAVSGIFLSLKTEINMKIVMFFTVAVLGLGYYFQISYYEWLIVVVTIILVFLAEMINTSIEAMTDLISKSWSEEAKTAKDISGGMVLVSCIGAFVIGMIIFFPKILLIVNTF